MYCKLYQSSKKTICEARGFPRTRLSSDCGHYKRYKITVRVVRY